MNAGQAFMSLPASCRQGSLCSASLDRWQARRSTTPQPIRCPPRAARSAADRTSAAGAAPAETRVGQAQRRWRRETGGDRGAVAAAAHDRQPLAWLLQSLHVPTPAARGLGFPVALRSRPCGLPSRDGAWLPRQRLGPPVPSAAPCAGTLSDLAHCARNATTRPGPPEPSCARRAVPRGCAEPSRWVGQ